MLKSFIMICVVIDLRIVYFVTCIRFASKDFYLRFFVASFPWRQDNYLDRASPYNFKYLVT